MNPMSPGRAVRRDAASSVAPIFQGDHGADVHNANLRDVHRRYAEVTMADDVIFYLGRIAASSDDPESA